MKQLLAYVDNGLLLYLKSLLASLEWLIVLGQITYLHPPFPFHYLCIWEKWTTSNRNNALSYKYLSYIVYITCHLSCWCLVFIFLWQLILFLKESIQNTLNMHQFIYLGSLNKYKSFICPKRQCRNRLRNMIISLPILFWECILSE